MLLQRPAKGLVGQDSGEVIHTAIAFGLTDDSDHLVRCELPASEASLEPGGVLNGLELNFCDFDRHGSVSYIAFIRCAHSPAIISSQLARLTFPFVSAKSVDLGPRTRPGCAGVAGVLLPGLVRGSSVTTRDESFRQREAVLGDV